MAAQAAEGSTVYADSGSSITSTVAAVDNTTVACSSCLFKGPGAMTFTNITSASSSAGGGSSLSGGAIAGIVIGALAGVAVVALLAWLLLRRRNQAAKDVEMAKAKPDKPQITSVKTRAPPGTPAVLVAVVQTALLKRPPEVQLGASRTNRRWHSQPSVNPSASLPSITKFLQTD